MANICSKQESKNGAPGNTSSMNCNDLSSDIQQNNLQESPGNEQLTQNITASSSIKMAEDSWYYKMDSPNRGLAIIFNHCEYKDERLTERKGTEYDKRSVETVLNNLRFEVHSYEDLTYSAICAVIKKAQQENHEDRDCFLLAVLTHGDIGGYLSAYDIDYSFSALWKPFTDKNCPSLKGKPRLFFVQACRGAKVMDPIQLLPVHQTETDATPYRLHQTETDASPFTSQETETAAIPYRNPVPNIEEHFLVAFATPETYLSWRSETDGTWFIQTLCEELEKYGNEYDLNFILTQVLRKVATLYESITPGKSKTDQKRQMPCIVTTLTYLLMFKKKV